MRVSQAKHARMQTMTLEKKLLFNLSDIRALRFTCSAKDCGGAQSFPVKEWIRTPRACSNNQEHDWLKGGSAEEQMISKFKESLQALIKYNGTSAFKLQLEFDASDEDSGR